MIETILTYLVFLPLYPVITVMYSIEMGFFLYLIGWLFIGSILGYFLHRLNNPVPFIILIVIWFMPSTIICGSATVMPWLSVIPYAFIEGNCAGVFSLGFSLAANLVIACCLRWIYLKVKNSSNKNA